MEAAKGKPRFIRESGVWLKTQLLCAAFSQHSSVAAQPSTWGDPAGEDWNQPHTFPHSFPGQAGDSLSKHLHAPAHISQLTLSRARSCANQECHFLMLFANYLLLVCAMPTCENPVESKRSVCLINCSMFRTLHNHHTMLLEDIFTIL